MTESGGGLGFLGLVLALLLVFAVRGCVSNSFQDSVNDFCVSQGFVYGEETISNTEVTCYSSERLNASRYDYALFWEYLTDDDSEEAEQ